MTLRVGDVLRGEGNRSQKRVEVVALWANAVKGSARWVCMADLRPLSKHRHTLASVSRAVNRETGLPDGYVKEGEG